MPENHDGALTKNALRNLTEAARVTALHFERMAIETGYIFRAATLPRTVARKWALGQPLDLHERIILRRALIRARGWRHRQYARLADRKTPVGHLVKPSARRPGRRPHRRRVR